MHNNIKSPFTWYYYLNNLFLPLDVWRDKPEHDGVRIGIVWVDLDRFRRKYHSVVLYGQLIHVLPLVCRLSCTEWWIKPEHRTKRV